MEDMEDMTEVAELSCTYDAETGGKHFMCTGCADTMLEMHRKNPQKKLKCYTCAQEVEQIHLKWVQRKRPRGDSDEDSDENSSENSNSQEKRSRQV